MDEQHVGVGIPVPNIGKCQRRARNGLTSEIHIVNSPRVGLVVVKIELVWPAAALICSSSRRGESESVSKGGGRNSQHNQGD